MKEGEGEKHDPLNAAHPLNGTYRIALRGKFHLDESMISFKVLLYYSQRGMNERMNELRLFVVLRSKEEDFFVDVFFEDSYERK